MMRLICAILLALTVSCSTQQAATGLDAVTVAAAAARLSDPVYQSQVNTILRGKRWSIEDASALHAAKRAMDDFRALTDTIDLERPETAAAAAPLLLGEYAQVTNKYRQAWAVIVARNAEFTAIEWAILSARDRDARRVNDVIVLALTPSDGLGIDGQQLIQDALVLLPVVIRAVALVL